MLQSLLGCGTLNGLNDVAAMNSDQEQILFRFLKQYRVPVHRLAYTEPFEQLCERMRAGSLHQKHEVFERAIELQSDDRVDEHESDESAGDQSGNATTPVATPPERTQATPRGTPSAAPIPPSLFEEPTFAQQTWTFNRKPDVDPEQDEARTRLLAGIAKSDFGTTELRVGYLLQHFPETRNSDVALCIRYWKKFQAHILEEHPAELEVLFDLDRWATIERVKREIQGKLQLFRATEEGQKGRDLYQKELYEYLAAHRDVVPEVRFYLDETGNEGDKRYTGVAGICVMNWRQYEKHAAALTQWREAQQWPETIHFADVTPERAARAVKLLGELAKRRAGLLFAGYALASRGRTYEDMFSLFVHLIVDSLKCLRDNGALAVPRTVRVIKEAEPGFDNQYLPKMNRQLAELIAIEFPGLLTVEPIEARTKGVHVFLECADLVAGGMQRRFSYKGRNPKDVLSEAVINVTGFEEPPERGRFVQVFPVKERLEATARSPCGLPAAIDPGLSLELVTAVKNATEEAIAARTQSTLRRESAKLGTAMFHDKADILRSVGGAAVATIRAFAEATNDPQVYDIAKLSPPSPPTPAGPPTPAVNFTADPRADGMIMLKWKGTVAQNASFDLERSVDGGPYVLLDNVRTKKFLDKAVPMNTNMIVYRIYGKRDGVRSTPETTNVLFGNLPAEIAAAFRSGPLAEAA